MTDPAPIAASLPPEEAARAKQCCARLYESEIVSVLLGDSFHPGGAALTERLGRTIGLAPGTLVLDAATGRGTSAVLLAERFGCSVVGIDLSRQNVERARKAATRLGLAERVRFEVGDAEHLPLEDASVDAVMCECAFCTFPDKPAAAREFARVLRPGGRVGLSDLTRVSGPLPELDDLMAWIACLADARPAEAYAALLADAGLTRVATERHDHVLTEMIRDIGTRLFAAEVLAGLERLDLTGIDIHAATRMTRQALQAVADGRIGYALVSAIKPSGAPRAVQMVSGF